MICKWGELIFFFKIFFFENVMIIIVNREDYIIYMYKWKNLK